MPEKGIFSGAEDASKDACKKTIKIFVNVPAEPFSTDLLFPCGVPINGRISLVVGDLSKLQAGSKCGAVPLAPFVLKQKVVINTPDSNGQPLCIPKPCDKGQSPESLWKCLTPSDSTVTLSAGHLAIDELDKNTSHDSREDESCLEEDSLPGSTVDTSDGVGLENEFTESPKRENEGCKGKTQERCVFFSDVSGSSGDSEDEDILRDELHEQPTLPEHDTFYCGLCDAGFKSRNSCWTHVWQHVPVVEKVYECEKCGMEFATAFVRDRHFKTCAGTKQKCTCDTCASTFDTVKELERHVLTHASKVVAYRCEYCGWYCLSKAHYDTHLVKNHADERQNCPHCALPVVGSQRVHLAEAHAEVEVFPCTFCSLTFATDELREKHEGEHHEIRLEAREEKRLYVCSVCGKPVSASLYVYNNHVRSHRNPSEARYLCSECGASLATPGGFRNHLATHAGEKPHACPECPQKFRTAFYLRKHLSNVHSPDFKHRCSHCPRKFVEAKKLHLHLAVLHEKDLDDQERVLISKLKRYRCEHCRFATYSQKVIRNHVDSHTGNYPFKCDTCSKGYSYRYQLTQHVAMNHAAEGGQCEDCGRVFYHDATFARHRQVHVANKGFVCNVCRKVYESEGLLRRHVNDNHPTETGSVSCEVCGKSFALSTSLRLHKMAVHGRHKPPRRRFDTDLVCDVCGVDFKFVGSLEAHKVVKHGERNESGRIVCPYCEKQSSSQLTLSLHMRLHFNEKPFKCKFCKKEFTLMASCKAHEERHRARKKFVCPHCETEFLFRSRLDRHLKTYHVALYGDDQQVPKHVEVENVASEAFGEV